MFEQRVDKWSVSFSSGLFQLTQPKTNDEQTATQRHVQNCTCALFPLVKQREFLILFCLNWVGWWRRCSMKWTDLWPWTWHMNIFFRFSSIVLPISVCLSLKTHRLSFSEILHCQQRRSPERICSVRPMTLLSKSMDKVHWRKIFFKQWACKCRSPC